MLYLSLSVLLSLCGLTGNVPLNVLAVCFVLFIVYPRGKISFPIVAILIVGLVFAFLTFRLSLSFVYPIIAFCLVKKCKTISECDWFISLALLYLTSWFLIFNGPESIVSLDRNYFSLISLSVSFCMPQNLCRKVVPNILRIILLSIVVLLLSRLFVFYLIFLFICVAFARSSPLLFRKLTSIGYNPNREFAFLIFANLFYCIILLTFFQPAFFLDKELSVEQQAGPARLANLNDRSNQARLLSTLGYIEFVIENPLANLRPVTDLNSYLDFLNSYSSSDEKIINTPHLTLLSIFVNYGILLGLVYTYLVLWLFCAIPRNNAFVFYAAYPAMFALGGVLFGSTVPLYFIVAHHRSILSASCKKR